MFNFREAITYIFKEKDWPLKMGLPFILQLIIIIPSAIYSFTTTKTTRLSYGINDFDISKYYSSGNSSNYATIFLCFVCVAIIPLIITSIWYTYENTQAAIQNRATKAIWKNKIEDTIKKAGKYFLVSLIYGILIALFIAIISGIVFSLFCAGAALITALAQGSGNSRMGLGTLAPGETASIIAGAGVLGFILLCCGAIIGLIIYVVLYLFVTPGMLRLIGTNTMSEGLKFGENWELGKKYSGTFLSLLGITILFGIVLGILTTTASFASSLLLRISSSPAIGIVLEVGFQIIVSVASLYISYFVMTRLNGQAFRYIAQKEAKLSHVMLKE